MQAHVKVRVTEANQSRALGKVAYTCSACNSRDGADATLYWRVRKAAGIPMVSGLVGTTYRCLACNAQTEGRPPAGVAPPFLHRFGWIVVIAVTIALGAIALKLALPDPAPRVSSKAQGQLDALKTRVAKASLVELTADIDCTRAVETALKQAAPDLWKAKPVAPSEPVVANDLPVVVDERKNVAPDFMTKRACTHVKPDKPSVFIGAGDDEQRQLALLAEKVAAYEAAIAELAPPERFVYVEAECLDDGCGARAALVTRDGKLLALSAVKLPARVRQEGYESRFRRALGTAIEGWARSR